MKVKTINILTGSILIFISVIFLLLIPSQIKGSGALGSLSALVPKISLLLIILLSVALIINSMKSSGEEIYEFVRLGENPEVGIKKVLLILALSLLVFAFYVFSLAALGFGLSTFIYVVLFSRLLGEKGWLNSFGAAIAITSIISYFSIKAQVFMPYGIVEKLFSFL